MTHLSSLQLDALALGALGDDDATAARTHLAACARCRADHDELTRLRGEFDATVLPATIAKLPTPLRPRRRRWLYASAPVLALAASLLVWLRPATESDDPELLIKGGPSLRIFARHAGTVAPVRPRTTLHPGDEIRFVVEPARYSYLLIASVDGSGKATVYYPWNGTESASIRPGKSELGGSIVLDDSPGPERLFAIFSTAPVPSMQVTSELQRIGRGGSKAIRDAHALAIDGAQLTLFFEKAP